MADAGLLLAEDDPAMVELLRWTFERQGFEVVHTPSGEEALLLALTGFFRCGMRPPGRTER